jgi:hypothetical protein
MRYSDWEIFMYVRYCLDKVLYFQEGDHIKMRHDFCSNNIIIYPDNTVMADIFSMGGSLRVTAALSLAEVHIYAVDMTRYTVLYDGRPATVMSISEYIDSITLPKVPKGILKIPEKL